MRIGIIAALPGELKPLVRKWEKIPEVRGSGIIVWRRATSEDEVIAVCAGMGSAAVKRAFAAAEFRGTLDLVLSVGWAGGLTRDERISPVVSEIIDAQTGERFTLTDGKRKLGLVTTAHVADAGEKRRLRESYGAAMVDMEAAAVARLAQMRGIPMVCLKVISDGADAALPDLNSFIDEMGRLRTTSFLGYVATRPRYWRSLLTLGRRSATASGELARSIERFLLHKDVDRVNRTGEV